MSWYDFVDKELWEDYQDPMIEISKLASTERWLPDVGREKWALAWVDALLAADEVLQE